MFLYEGVMTCCQNDSFGQLVLVALVAGSVGYDISKVGVKNLFN